MYLDNLRIFRANFLLARTNKIRAEEVKNLLTTYLLDTI